MLDTFFYALLTLQKYASVFRVTFTPLAAMNKTSLSEVIYYTPLKYNFLCVALLREESRSHLY